MIREQQQLIESVDPGSPAEKAGINAGEALLAINGEPVLDVIDYTFLTSASSLLLKVKGLDGSIREVHIRKSEITPLGLGFSTGLMSRMRTCANHCDFCFVDQMPPGMRDTLNAKDDDWRLSFIMGNYVTLTNVSDAEFERMLKRKAGPLYISVHATRPEIREGLMHNRNAGKLLSRLRALKDAGITFHCQVVACPGLNDGEILTETMADLAALYPQCGSLAVVPVGITQYREGLRQLGTYDRESSRQMISLVEGVAEGCRNRLGTSFVFLSDEWYLKAELPLPAASYYEDYVQIENGVGLLRLYEEDFLNALEEQQPLSEPLELSMAGGEGAYPFFREMYKCLEAYGIRLRIFPVRNTFFGGNINVAGLITAGDLLHSLAGKSLGRALLIPKNMLREQEDVFLDDITLREVSDRLGVPVIPVPGGDDMIDILFHLNDYLPSGEERSETL